MLQLHTIHLFKEKEYIIQCCIVLSNERFGAQIGLRKIIVAESEEKVLTERRLSNVRTFDAKPCLGTSLQDLDISLIKKEFLSKAVAEDILAEDKRSIEEQLASLGFFDLRYNCPTIGAIILFGNNPERFVHGSYIQYVRFKGKDRAGDIIHEFKFDGNLCKSLPKIDTFIETSVSIKRPIPVSVLREEIVSQYPYWATRELLMNAIMHRDYDSNAPIQFYEYDDRIEIQNPGGLYGKVSPINFPNVSDYRNPFIAEAMKVLGYVNRFSRGVYRVQKELQENGNGEAMFDFSLHTAFRVVENVSKKYFEEGFGTDTQKTSRKHPENIQKTKTTQQQIIDAIKANPTITRKELIYLLNSTEGSIKHHLSQLTKKGIIKREGSDRTGRWVVNEYPQ